MKKQVESSSRLVDESATASHNARSSFPTTAWFGKQEYDERIENLRAELQKSSIDAIVLSEPESITYITGFFTMGYSTSFQLAIVPVASDPIVLYRDVERSYFKKTSAYQHGMEWSDGDDTDLAMAGILGQVATSKARIGIERSSWMMTAHRHERISSAFPKTSFVDASSIVPRLRAVKSVAEIGYMRQAATVAEVGMSKAVEAIRTGIDERELAGVIVGAMMTHGGDHGTDLSLASGERAFHVHGVPEDKVVNVGDTIFVEVAPCVRQYHARFMRSFKVGPATSDERRLAEHLAIVQDNALSAVGDGEPVSEADRRYRDGVAATGVSNYPNKTFYSVGLLLHPNTFEPLQVDRSSRWSFVAGQTFHTYVIVKGICLSETILVTRDGHERLTNFPRELVTKE